MRTNAEGSKLAIGRDCIVVAAGILLASNDRVDITHDGDGDLTTAYTRKAAVSTSGAQV